jgi:hypothetical protein
MRHRRGDVPWRRWALLLLFLFLTSCSRFVTPAVQTALVSSPSSACFPQEVLQHGDYAAFLAENEKMLQRCTERIGCDEALFNLGFVYAYPQSPYRDRATALWYFDELKKLYPQSPWASQARVWVAFLNESLALEESRRQLQAHLHTREERIRTLREQLKAARRIDIEMDKKERELLR